MSGVNQKLLHEPPNIDGYQLVGRLQIPLGRVSLIGLLTTPLWVLLFLGLSRLMGGHVHLRFDITISGVLLALFNLLIFMPALHEAIHGIVARAFGARPTFGIGAGFAYTTFREPIRPIPYLLVGVAPLLVLSAIGIVVLTLRPIYPGQTLIFLVGNATGAFGDLWMLWRVPQLPRGSLICDLADGFAYYLPATGGGDGN
ncbi:MAG TPA: DUF3267 domain-containing protein [Nitrolancea sp.]|nr:DUF3267 domain-containing protein [Nitrolancea sp.]